MPVIIYTEDAFEDRQYWYGPYSLPAWGRDAKQAERYPTPDDADKAAMDWGITNYALKETRQ